MLKWVRVFQIVLLAFLGSVGPVRADAVAVSGPLDGSYCVPFGCSPGTIYQQVFDRSLFSHVLDVTGIDFFNTAKDSGGDQYVDPAHYELWFSTTSAAVNGLNATDFAANRGATTTRVFVGDLGGSLAGEVPPRPGATLPFSWTNPFHYDPRGGNLLLEVRKTGGSFFGDDGTYLDFSSHLPGSSIVSNFDGATAWNNQSAGLMVRLNGTFGAPVDNPAPVPEPATLILLGTGLAGVLAGRNRPL